MKKIYRLVDKDNKIIFQGSLEECSEKEIDRLEYVGIEVPVYHVINNKGIDETGTMQELAEKLNMSYLTLYNYTRYKRKHDGLFVEKVGDTFIYDNKHNA